MQERLRIFLQRVAETQVDGVIACKPSRYPKMREWLGDSRSQMHLLPVANPNDFSFFLSRIDSLFLDDVNEFQFLLERGYLQLPITIRMG